MDWKEIVLSMNQKGYAIIPNKLSLDECDEMVRLYDRRDIYRSIINMQQYRFGRGEYKYFSYPLPPRIQSLRKVFYESLAPLANDWMEKLSIANQFPPEHDQFISVCKIKNQIRPTPLILKYELGGFNTLHRDLYGEVYFPCQVVFALSQAGKDFEGAEFILVEQIPRAQSRAEVIQLNKGDALVFTTNFRPVKGSKGYFRTAVRHGISPVRSGICYALGIPFHDAL